MLSTPELLEQSDPLYILGEAVKEFLSSKNMRQADLCRKIGISESAMSLIVNKKIQRDDKTNGTNPSSADYDKIKLFLSGNDNHLDCQFFTDFSKLLAMAKNDKLFRLVDAPSGHGKSYAAKKFTKSTSNVIYIEVKDESSASTRRGIIESIAFQMGIKIANFKPKKLYDEVIKLLRDSSKNYLIIIDEAERLDKKSVIGFLKGLADATNIDGERTCGFVIFAYGLLSKVNRWCNRKGAEEGSLQFYSRTKTNWLTYQPMKATDSGKKIFMKLISDIVSRNGFNVNSERFFYEKYDDIRMLTEAEKRLQNFCKQSGTAPTDINYELLSSKIKIG